MTLDDLLDDVSRLLNDGGIDTASWSDTQKAKAANWACQQLVTSLGLTLKDGTIAVSANTPTAPILDLSTLDPISVLRVEV